MADSESDNTEHDWAGEGDDLIRLTLTPTNKALFLAVWNALEPHQRLVIARVLAAVTDCLSPADCGATVKVYGWTYLLPAGLCSWKGDDVDPYHIALDPDELGQIAPHGALCVIAHELAHVYYLHCEYGRAQGDQAEHDREQQANQFAESAVARAYVGLARLSGQFGDLQDQQIEEAGRVLARQFIQEYHQHGAST